MRFLLREIVPFREAESLERTVIAIEHSLRMTLEEQGQGSPRGANIHCLPQAIQDQNMLVEHRIHNNSTGAKTTQNCLMCQLSGLCRLSRLLCHVGISKS